MSKEDLQKVLDLVFEIGESEDHFVDFDFFTRTYSASYKHGYYCYVTVHRSDKNGHSKEVCDSMDIDSLNERALTWLEYWKLTIAEERANDEMV